MQKQSKFRQNKDSFTLIYNDYTNLELSKKFDVSIHTITSWAYKLKLRKKPEYRNHKAIDINHEKLILENYESGDLDEISRLTGKNKHAIREYARKRGLKRKVDITRNGTLEPLLSGTLQSFYWLGLIAADGYISTKGHFMLSQSEKDKENVINLSKYLNSDIYTIDKSRSGGFKSNNNHYRVNISDKKLGVKIREEIFRLDEDQNKTKHGISLDFIKTTNQALSFLIGFIDGDGSTNSGDFYRIQCDDSWTKIFAEFSEKLPNDFDFSLSSLYRKDKKKFFCNFYIKKNGSIILHRFISQHDIVCSFRKFLNHIT